MTVTKVIRWILVPVAAFAVWVAALLLGIGGVTVLDSLCPPELVVSGACTAPWHAPAVKAVAAACAAFAAAGVVMLPATVAPHHRVHVAVVSYILGAAFATYVAWAGALWVELVSAAVSGSAALWWSVRRWRSHRPGRA